ncbi:hypothetical protein SAMN06265348_104414 [Pedobacter westerhofensis]|uniref:Uncharacterized protein n=1 Tax=Pedobacter westerhofensis TaxID=425512 RepID=A0A521D2F5_9SPHI|nr:hypothetical protein SAMN06265348_104414 [Pedobacter westerhofensis]
MPSAAEAQQQKASKYNPLFYYRDKVFLMVIAP